MPISRITWVNDTWDPRARMDFGKLIVGILFTPQIPDLLNWAFFDLALFASGYPIGP